MIWLFRIDRTLVNLESIEANVERKRTEPLVRMMSAPGGTVQKKPSQQASSDENNQKQKQVSSIAEEIISQALVKAKAIIREAEAEALEIKKLARQRGYDEGIFKADALIEAAIEKDKDQLKNIILRIEEKRREMFDSMESEMLRLTFSIIKKVFSQVSKSDSSLFESMISNALMQMNKEGKITIRVNTEEYERFFSAGDMSFVIGDKLLTAAVLPDPNMNCGDCIIESEGETVNAGINNQLRRIEIAFQQADGVPV
ncbi:MAG: hypothetical protein GX111_10080 [Clostridiales bacterium]|nr:hypothetical protein [Clostridiales bacterium]